MATDFNLRQRAIRWRLAAKTVEALCNTLNRSASWFFKWWQRYRQHGADRLRDLSRAPKHLPRRLSEEIRAAIIHIRDRLMRRRGPQARYRLAGAPTIRHELEVLGCEPLPSLRQIEPVLHQGGRTCPAFPFRPAARTTSYPAPVAKRSNQVQQRELIRPRYLQGAHARYYFLTYRHVFDHAVYAEFQRAPHVSTVLDFVVSAWQRVGVPHYLQVDNDLLFGNPGRWPGSLRRFVRRALRVGVQVIFIPEGEPYRKGAIEHFNGWLQEPLLAVHLHWVGQVWRERCALQ